MKATARQRTKTTMDQEKTEQECQRLVSFFESVPIDHALRLISAGMLELSETIDAEGKLAGSRLSISQKCDAESASGQGDTAHPHILVRLTRELHISYLINKGLDGLGPHYVCLDASRPWLAYWIVHSLDLLDALHPSPTAMALDLVRKRGEAVVNSTETIGFGAPPMAPQSSGREYRRRVASSLRQCQHPVTGGFGGGNQQSAHCAPTYAAVLALLAVGGAGSTPSRCSSDGGEDDGGGVHREDIEIQKLAYETINRPKLYAWFLSLKASSGAERGGFRMHEDGEVDVRGTYTVVAIAALLNLLTPELTAGVADYALRCQTYEGGFGGEPGAEAHGGYVFCAVAALCILREGHRIDLPALEKWLVDRQLPREGGFQGRANKLVDGCYSFWQGGTAGILEHLLSEKSQHEQLPSSSPSDTAPPQGIPSSFLRWSAADPPPPASTLVTGGAGLSASLAGTPPKEDALNHNRLFDAEALQRYTLMLAQDPNGGLRDKPSKPRDFYHSCYNLGGLAVAQHHLDSYRNFAARTGPDRTSTSEARVWGSHSNAIDPIHLGFNIKLSAANAAMEYFSRPEVPCDHSTLLQLSGQ